MESFPYESPFVLWRERPGCFSAQCQPKKNPPNRRFQFTASYLLSE